MCVEFGDVCMEFDDVYVDVYMGVGNLLMCGGRVVTTSWLFSPVVVSEVIFKLLCFLEEGLLLC